MKKLKLLLKRFALWLLLKTREYEDKRIDTLLRITKEEMEQRLFLLLGTKRSFTAYPADVLEKALNETGFFYKEYDIDTACLIFERKNL